MLYGTTHLIGPISEVLELLEISEPETLLYIKDWAKNYSKPYEVPEKKNSVSPSPIKLHSPP